MTRPRSDRVILFTTLAIVCFGLFVLCSATLERGAADSRAFHPLFLRQLVWMAVGLVLMTLVSKVDYIRILDFAYLAYAANLLLLFLTLAVGGVKYGAKRWMDLGAFSLQPSEFIKITVVFALASFLGSRKESMGGFGNFFYSCLFVAPAFLAIFLQPDLGTAIILVPILFSILFVCGENVKYIVSSLLLGLAGLPVVWHVLKDYQRTRLLVFVNPNLDPLGAGYTIIQSKIAIGSGGLFGKGWLGGTQSHLRFLPESHTDFIFSAIGEEWGFVGALCVLGLYCALTWRGIRIIRGVDDIYGKAIATGVVTLVAFQALVNIAMTIGLMPVVGIPLPLVSYGGSSAVATLVGIGFLLSVSRRRKR